MLVILKKEYHKFFRRVFNGHVVDDPENPKIPHRCEPILYVDALAEHFSKRLHDEGKIILYVHGIIPNPTV